MQASRMFFQQYWRNCQSGIPAEVILGSPKTEKCDNFGICRVSLDLNSNLGGCGNTTVAYLRIDPPTNRLLIHFLSCSLNDEVTTRFFESSTFRMDDDYYLPKNVGRSLTVGSTPKEYCIEKGNYPILADEHFHTVSLRLTQAMELAEDEIEVFRRAA